MGVWWSFCGGVLECGICEETWRWRILDRLFFCVWVGEGGAVSVVEVAVWAVVVVRGVHVMVVWWVSCVVSVDAVV